ncbi:hypothetical protein HYW58_03055, partial [Candidatus Kaiserbacteria bacterium]|nr:hypothetical protein [Candidatus Kaiserbacteria bacterium]
SQPPVLSGEESTIEEETFVVTHQNTPEPVKAIYLTQCVAGTPSIRNSLVKLIENTELNSVVIDIKDYSGTLIFESQHPLLKANIGEGCRAPDLQEFIGALHEKNIYVIGRITVFQDPFYTKLRPDLAVKRSSDINAVWKDYKGLSFIEVGAKEFWDYIVAIGEESYTLGFDELNFDYIRFPSDGNMNDIYYPFSEEMIVADPDTGKAKVLREFFAYLQNRLKPTGAVLSADLFGMTMTNPDDLNIGQVLEYAAPYFDYIAPMVYPSHYPKGFNGWENPNEHVYGVVNFSMLKGVERMIMASSTPSKLRPWLQDFDYGGDYGAEEVRAQIQATYDAGLSSWMLWNPSNVYTTSALEPSLDSAPARQSP